MQINTHIHAAPPGVSAPAPAPAAAAADPAPGTAPAEDAVELSPQAQAQAEDAEESAEESSDPQELTQEEQEQVKELSDRDREVRAHEQAHVAAAGPYARGGPSYEYQRGPDGKRYAIGGEVQIDTSPVANDPEATIRKAQVVKRAALAPAEPSDQDRRVAAEAVQMEMQARQEMTEQRRAESDLQPAATTSGSAPDAAGEGTTETAGASPATDQADAIEGPAANRPSARSYGHSPGPKAAGQLLDFVA